MRRDLADASVGMVRPEPRSAASLSELTALLGCVEIDRHLAGMAQTGWSIIGNGERGSS